jgi:hypothetical protein
VNARDAVNLGMAVAIVGGVVVLGVLDSRVADDPTAASTPVPTSTAAASTPVPVRSTAPGDGTLPGGTLDPATLPVRSVERALFVTEVFGVDGAGLLAVDAATGEWVVPDLVWDVVSQPLHLSPDGRTLLRTQWDQGGGVRVELVELGTGATREVDVPLPPDCSLDSVTWAPDGRHLGAVSGCSEAQVYPEEPTYRTLVQEIDLSTGTAHVVEVVPDAGPSETYPSYSPDGRFLAYGIGRAIEDDEEEAWASVRVTPVQGGKAHEWEHTHLVYGDPWRDATTVLAWDEWASTTGPDSHVLLSAETGTQEPYGIDRLTNLSGFVTGTLLAQQTDWVDEPIPCTVALCTVDLRTGAVAPWLTLPEGTRTGFVSPARTLLAEQG